MSRGHFGVGILGCKTEHNVGTLWRTAHSFGADYLFTIGRRYRRQPTDTTRASRQMPLFHFDTFEAFHKVMPHEARLIGVEVDDRAVPLAQLEHPKMAVYLLGAEDNGLPARVLDRCWRVVALPGAYCLNVAVAGSIVLYDRLARVAS